MVINFLLATFGQTVDITVTTIRLAITLADALGRVVAAINFLGMGLRPVGPLLGGVLGSFMVLRAGLLLAAAGFLLSPLVMLFSLLTRLGTVLPETDQDIRNSPARS